MTPFSKVNQKDQPILARTRGQSIVPAKTGRYANNAEAPACCSFVLFSVAPLWRWLRASSATALANNATFFRAVNLNGPAMTIVATLGKEKTPGLCVPTDFVRKPNRPAETAD